MYTTNDPVVNAEIESLKNKTKNLPRIHESDILWMWSMNYYDGILSAIGMFNGEPVYVECISTGDIEYFREDVNNHESRALTHRRVFIVQRLEQADFMIMLERHLIWKKYCGWHNDMSPGKFARDRRLLENQTDPNKAPGGYEQYKAATKDMTTTNKTTDIGYFINDVTEIGDIEEF